MKERISRFEIAQSIRHDLPAILIQIASWKSTAESVAAADTVREAPRNEDAYETYQSLLSDLIDFANSQGKKLTICSSMDISGSTRHSLEPTIIRAGTTLDLTDHDIRIPVNDAEKPLYEHRYRKQQLYIGDGHTEIAFNILAAALKQNARLSIVDAASGAVEEAYSWQDLLT